MGSYRSLVWQTAAAGLIGIVLGVPHGKVHEWPEPPLTTRLPIEGRSHSPFVPRLPRPGEKIRSFMDPVVYGPLVGMATGVDPLSVCNAAAASRNPGGTGERTIRTYRPGRRMISRAKASWHPSRRSG